MAISKKRYWFIICLFALTSAYIYGLGMNKETSSSDAYITKLPLKIENWSGKNLKYPDWLPEAIGTDNFLFREYTDDNGRSVVLYAAYFGARWGNFDHNPEVCYPAAGWTIESKKTEEYEFAHNPLQKWKLIRLVVAKGSDREQILYWFEAGKKKFASILKFRLFALSRSVLFDRPGGAMVRVSADLDDAGEREVAQFQRDFLRKVIPVLTKYMPN